MGTLMTADHAEKLAEALDVFIELVSNNNVTWINVRAAQDALAAYRSSKAAARDDPKRGLEI